jgi:hypothetical protein
MTIQRMDNVLIVVDDLEAAGRLEDHPDQLRIAFGLARRIDACCGTCLFSCARPSDSRSHRHCAASGIERSVPCHTAIP